MKLLLEYRADPNTETLINHYHTYINERSRLLLEFGINPFLISIDLSSHNVIGSVVKQFQIYNSPVKIQKKQKICD